MLTIIFVMLGCMLLYAFYMHFGPFSHCGDTLMDKVVNVAAFLLWIGLAIPLAIMIVPDQTTTFGTVVYVIGCVLALMFVELIVEFMLFCIVAWFSYSVFHRPYDSVPKRKRKIKR